MTDVDTDILLKRLDRVRREFLETLSLPGEKSGASGETNSWSGPVDDWWTGARGNASPEVADLYAKLVEHGRVLFNVAEQLHERQTKGNQRPNAALMTLLEAFQKDLKQTIDDSPRQAGMFSPVSHLAALWQQQAEAMFGIAANIASDILPHVAKRTLPEAQETIDRLLAASIPGAGIVAPRRVNAVLEALIDYQQHLNAFMRLAVRIASDAIGRTERELTSNDDERSLGVQDLYAIWLKCCEESYDEIVREDDYPRMLSALVNSAVRLRARRQELADASSSALGIPSRTDVRLLASALQDTRRRLRHYERTHNRPDADAPALREKSGTPVGKERSSHQMGEQKNAPVKPAATSKKKTAKKKVTKKKAAAKKAVKKKAARKKAAAKASKS